MGLFYNPRRKKDKWATLVIDNAKTGMEYDESFLVNATTTCIQQHAKVLYDCIHIVLTTTNKKTKDERYKLAQEKFAVLVKLKKYANKEQKIGINLALNDFLKMEDMYRHPGKIKPPTVEIKKQNKKQKKEDFWDVYAQGEMMDIFSGDDN